MERRPNDPGSDRIDCWAMSFPFSRVLFPTIMADEVLLLHEFEDSEVLLDLLEEEEDFPILGAACCFMRRNLNRVAGYFEATVNMYSPGEFQSHFRLSRGSFEQLCREVINTDRILITNRGREHIPPEKQVLAFVWMMANQESSRSVADRFNITLSSLHRVLKRCSRGLTDLCGTYIKWPDGKSYVHGPSPSVLRTCFEKVF